MRSPEEEPSTPFGAAWIASPEELSNTPEKNIETTERTTLQNTYNEEPSAIETKKSEKTGSTSFSEQTKEMIARKIVLYEGNPYVEVNKRGRLILNKSFYTSAVPFCDLPVKDMLRIFKINPVEFNENELLQIRKQIKRAQITEELAQEYDSLYENDVTLEIAINRMITLETEIDRMLKEIKIFVSEMNSMEKKKLCLILEGFPNDPRGKYTKQHLHNAVGIAHNSYYCYVKKERYGAAISAKDALDEKDVRRAFEYKGYPKGVRMVYMLIPRLTGRKIGLDRVRRIMRKYGMDSGLRKPSTKKAEIREMLKERRKPNLLRRMFRLHKPNEIRLTDVTEIECAGDFKAYGSALIDPVTGVLVTFDVSDSNDLDLAMTTLHNADKHPCKDGGIIHSDQGILYLSPVFQSEAEAMGLTQSMSRRGNCWDNAPQESFFGHFKDDCRDKYIQCETIAELREVIEEYAYYYNYERGVWERNHMTPMEYEAYLLSLTDEEYAAYMEQETERFINKKEEAKMKAIERNKNGL